MNDLQSKFYAQGLYRPSDRAVVAGVCAGLGRRYGLEPWTARIVFVLILMVLPGSQFLVYPLLWILMPKESTIASQPTYGTPPMT